MSNRKLIDVPLGVFALMRVAEKLRATADALEAASSQEQVTRIFSRLRYSARGWHEWSASTEGVTVVDRRDEWRAKFNLASRPYSRCAGDNNYQ